MTSSVCIEDLENEGNDHLDYHHIIPPYQPYGIDGPTVTADESLPLLYRYCKKFSFDRSTVCNPDFKTEEITTSLHTEVLYKVTINLPAACPLKETIECNKPCQSMELAKKAAALKAIEMLHVAGELNHKLNPSRRKDLGSDEEDFKKMAEMKIKHAGTENRVMYYRNKTASCLRKTPTAQVTSTCYLYTFTMERSMNEFVRYFTYPCLQTTNWSILTCNPIPYKKIPNFSLYVEHVEVFISINEQEFPFLLSSTELDILKQFHQTVFCKILKFEEFKFSSEMSDRGYLIVPTLTSNSTKYSYLEEAKNIVDNLNKKELFMPPHESTDLLNSVVIKSYTTNDAQLYEVIEVNKNETPQSPFPDDPSITYMQYFADKYNFQIKNATQYSLTCKALSMSFNKLVSSCKVRNLGRGRQNQIKLFPELCKVLPLSASQWKSYSYIPSILYRLEAFLLMNELSDQISIISNIGLSRIGEYTTYSDLSAEDFTSRPLRSALFRRNSRGEVFIEEDIVPIDGVLRKPDNALLLRSFTTCSANDIINLERLERIGVSFLKLSTTIDLFCSRIHDREGQLSLARERRTSGFNLCHLAKKKHLQMRLFTSPFENWIPPGFVLNDSMPQICPDAVTSEELPEKVLKYFYHMASDKNIADGIEAMLGAYIIAGGIECGLKWLQWLGMKLNTSHDKPMATNTSHPLSQSSYTSLQRCETNLPLLINGSCDIFRKHGYMPRSPLLIPPGECANEYIARRIGSCFKPPRPLIGGRSHNISLCEKLDWEFHDQSLLLQALTFSKNRMTDNYQRLEFLGDAVLDYLVTCYIFCEFPNYTQGQINAARSALVSNITFAEIAVKELKLHKHLFHLLPALFKHISEYVEFIENDSDINDEENVELYCNSKSDENISPTASTSSDNQTGNDEVEEIEPPKALGDVLESLAAALFLDSNMNLELVWSKFYPFFKPIIDKFSSNGPPVHPIAELLRLDPNAKIEPSYHDTNLQCCSCTITLSDKDIQVTCTAKSYKKAKYGAAKRILDKINSNNYIILTL